MIALHILDVKDFMSKLLLLNTFDHFLLSEAVITTHSTFTIDGYLNKEFYSEEELQTLGLTNSKYLPWGQLKPICFELIKGKRTPLNFKFVFQLAPDARTKLVEQSGLSFIPEDVNGLFINLKYDGKILSCVTGSSLKLFTLDKSLDQVWDGMMQTFFKQKEIAFEVM